MAGDGPEFLVHRDGDAVAVATQDLSPGNVKGTYVHDEGDLEAQLLEDVPLGHKFALKDVTAGDQVIEYGNPVAVATKDIRAGQYVHTHNVRSIRWQRSIAN